MTPQAASGPAYVTLPLPQVSPAVQGADSPHYQLSVACLFAAASTQVCVLAAGH